MSSKMVLTILAAALAPASAAWAEKPGPRVLSVSIDDPQPWGQQPRDATVVSAGQKLTGTIALSSPLGPAGSIRVQWRDTYGRIGASATVTDVAGMHEVNYELPLDRPVAVRGWVEVILQPTGPAPAPRRPGANPNASGSGTEVSKPDSSRLEPPTPRRGGRPQDARAAFVVHSPPRAWDEHYIFVWAHYPAGFGSILRSIGISGQDTYRFSPQMVQAVQLNDLYTYVDNIYWPIFSGYLKRRDRWKTILRTWGESPRRGSPYSSPWNRDPCLSRPGTVEAFERPMQSAAQANRDGRLMFYNMVDEMGLGLMSAPTNFCGSRPSRVAFGRWLRASYGSLAALNVEWDTEFASWNEVIAFHPTFEAMFDRLYGQVLLDREFRTVAAMNKVLGGAMPSFAAAADFYAATRTSRKVDADYLATRFRKGLDQLNATCGSKFKSLEQAASFYGKFDAWTFTLEAGEDFGGWNLSPWCDFRRFMDEQVADAIGAMRRIGRRFDPGGRFGITGTHQPSATTGQNYALLAGRVDVLVPYERGSAARLLHSLRPEMIVLRPVWPRQSPAAYAWFRLLDGDDGTIYWDNDEEGLNFVDRKTGQPTALARTLAPVHRRITRGLGKQVLAGRHDDCGVAVYYSHPSVRVAWWQQHLGAGRKWIEISSRRAVQSERSSRVRHAWCDLIENLGLQYRFVEASRVGAGPLRASGVKVLVLPEVTALSDAEAAEIRQFARAGGVVIADRLPGVFDEHGKARLLGALEPMWRLANAHLLAANVEHYGVQWRRGEPEAAALRARVGRILLAAVRPPLRIVDRDSQRPVIEPIVHVWHLGGSVRLVGVVANWSEYRTRGYGAWQPGPKRLALRLPAPAHVWDVKAGKRLGRLDQVPVEMGEDYSAVLALADEPIAPLKVGLIRDGRLVRVALAGDSPAVRRVVRVDVLDPSDAPLLHYGANLLLTDATRGRGEHRFALALNERPGDYRVVVRDVLTGRIVKLPLKVAAGQD